MIVFPVDLTNIYDPEIRYQNCIVRCGKKGHYYGIFWPNKARVKQKPLPTHYEYSTSQVDVVQALIQDRVAVASSQETGRDLEHCVVLIRKFDDFEKVCNMGRDIWGRIRGT